MLLDIDFLKLRLKALCIFLSYIHGLTSLPTDQRRYCNPFYSFLSLMKDWRFSDRGPAGRHEFIVGDWRDWGCTVLKFRSRLTLTLTVVWWWRGREEWSTPIEPRKNVTKWRIKMKISYLTTKSSFYVRHLF